MFGSGSSALASLIEAAAVVSAHLLNQAVERVVQIVMLRSGHRLRNPAVHDYLEDSQIQEG